VTALVLWELRRDLGQTLFDTIALLVGLRMALWLGPVLARYLDPGAPAHSRGLALLIVFVVASAAALAIGYYLNALTRWTMDQFDRVAGLVLGFSSAVIVCHVLVTSMALMWGTPKGPPAFVKKSHLGQEALSFRTAVKVVRFFDGLRV
jgi:hypothetical protein